MNQQELLKYLSYNPLTGDVIWKKAPSQKIKVGATVGYVSADGYMYFGFQNKILKLHRVVYLMSHGILPKYIDHIDHNRLNNRLANLREASLTDNARNCALQRNNKSGVVGVSWSKERNRWIAMIWHKSKAIPLGRFVDKETAIKARKDAEVKYGYHSNHGL